MEGEWGDFFNAVGVTAEDVAHGVEASIGTPSPSDVGSGKLGIVEAVAHAIGVTMEELADLGATKPGAGFSTSNRAIEDNGVNNAAAGAIVDALIKAHAAHGPIYGQGEGKNALPSDLPSGPLQGVGKSVPSSGDSQGAGKDALLSGDLPSGESQGAGKDALSSVDSQGAGKDVLSAGDLPPGDVPS